MQASWKSQEYYVGLREMGRWAWGQPASPKSYSLQWVLKGVAHGSAEFGSMFQKGLGVSVRGCRMYRWPHPRSSPLPRATLIQCWSVWGYKDPAISLQLRTILMGHPNIRWEHIGSWGFPETTSQFNFFFCSTLLPSFPLHRCGTKRTP